MTYKARRQSSSNPPDLSDVWDDAIHNAVQAAVDEKNQKKVKEEEKKAKKDAEGQPP